jgi:radical SAM-linked protein
MILRLRSTKLGPIRFVGHRDMGRVWERALRRAAIPMVYSAGFTPRPRIAFGLALGLGAESVAEYIDVEIVEPLEFGPERLEAFTEMMPAGVEVTAAAVLDPPVPSLQEVVTSCTWLLWSPVLGADEISSARAVLDADEVWVSRHRKGSPCTDEVRGSILDLRDGPEPGQLVAELSTVGRTLRPSELCSVIFERRDPADIRVRRLAQWIGHDDQRREVLSLPDPVAAADGRLRKDSHDRSPTYSIWRPGQRAVDRSDHGYHVRI